MKSITKFSVDYPVTILMIILAVLLLGYISFNKLGIDLFPDLNNPRIYVEITAGERPPEEIEKQFVENIESLAIRQRNAVQVSSVSRVGSAQIVVEYTWETDMDEAFLDLQKALTALNQNSDLDDMTITRHDPNSAPVMLVGFSNPEITDMDELRRVAENYLRNELVRLEGVAEVELLGDEVKEAIIETDDYKLKAYGVTADEIASKITSSNLNMSAGSIEEMGINYIIKGVGEFKSSEDIENVVLTYKNDASLAASAQSISNRIPVYLSDVATVSYINKKPENIVHVNGDRCMALAVYKETKFNTVKAADALLRKMADLQNALPGYKLFVISNQGEFITNSINEVKQSALIGVILAVIVLYVFLRRFGVTFVISLAIPISIVATFNMMYFKGLTLNIMTLGGLALGAGMLVDNAIIVMENIYRNLEEGVSLRKAAIDGTASVAGAITASTLTTIVVFLPIVFIHGSASELFKDQAWTVAFSLLSSLAVAILVIPMMSVWFLKKEKNFNYSTVNFPRYKGFLDKVLNRSGAVILGSVILVGLAIAALPFVGSEFIPKTDSNEFTINIKLTEGTDLSRTESTVKNIETIITEMLGKEITTIYSKIGPSTNLSGESSTVYENENTASILIKLDKKRKLSSNQIINMLSSTLGNFEDMETEFIQEQSELQTSLGTNSAPLVVEVKGEDIEILQDLSVQVKEKLEAVPGLINISTSFDKGRPEVDVVIDRVRAGLLNITINTVINQIKSQLNGVEAGQWLNKGEFQDIVLKTPDFTLKELTDFTIRNGSETISLVEIADIQLNQTTNEIYRRNQSRVGKISMFTNSDKPFDSIVNSINSEIKKIDFPADYKYEITGEELLRKESFGSLKFALLLSIILVYMVMASQFESLLHPFIILFTIPLAGIGTVFLFLITGNSFNVMAYIGVVMLAGIAVNDSIILVDAINQLKSEGHSRREAILIAGQRRIRPIIMTSLTTILALLPLTIGFGEGASLRAPLALAVIGGLISSTILTLIVIPCVYLKLDKAFSKVKA